MRTVLLGAFLAVVMVSALHGCSGAVSPGSQVSRAAGPNRGTSVETPDDESQPEILGGSENRETLDEQAGGVLVVLAFLAFIAAGALLPFLLL